MTFPLAKAGGPPGDRLRQATAAVAIAAALLAMAVPLGMLTLPPIAQLATAAVALLFPIHVLLQARRTARVHDVLGRDFRDLRLQLDRDPLTHLMSRDAFNEALDELPSAHAGHCVILLFFDLDRFKDVNDTLGHKAGDHLLVEVARRARAVLEDASAFARLGGDEFAAIVRWADDKRPEDYGHAIVEAMNEPFLIDGQTVEVAASVGIAVGDVMLDDGHELLRRADAAMYEVKGSPRGGCRIYDDMLRGRQVRESSIRAALGQSLVEQAFVMHYQPIVDARTGRLSSAEGLLRAQLPTLGDVPISTLIEVAEASGHIMPLTDWTLDTVLETIKALETTPLAVNISPIYFRHPDFVHRVLDRLLASRVRPELLTIEVTEGVLISDISSARQSISQLREVGVKVFLDDFGTGFSSLSYLQHFELDGLKLDKSFLREVGDKPKSTQIIRSVIDFGHSLDMRVVVEGVESDWQARLLQLLGCDLLQGYELGVPMPLHQLREYRDAFELVRPDSDETAGAEGQKRASVRIP